MLLLHLLCFYVSIQTSNAKAECTRKRCLLEKPTLKFMILGDWGGLPVWPFFSPAQVLVSAAMGTIADLHQTDFQIAVGDNFYLLGVKNEFDDRFTESFENIYTHPTLQTPWYVLAGNHDHNGNTTAQMVYSKKSSRWTFPRLFYVIKYELSDGTKVDIIMIDTVILCGQTKDGQFSTILNYLKASSSKPHGPKNRRLAERFWKWIELKLKNSTADYIFVAGHYPVYSIADHGPTQCLIDRLNPLMQMYNVTAYLSGHDHNLQHLRVNVNGTTLHYVLSGAGAFTDVSTEHEDRVPEGSLHFYYPKSSWFNFLNNAGFITNGGFVLAELDSRQVNFTYFSGRAQNLYNFTAAPRKPDFQEEQNQLESEKLSNAIEDDLNNNI